MAQELTLITNHKPGFFNKDMLLGALLGGMVRFGMPVIGIGSVVGAAIGGTIGGLIGKNAQYKENAIGKKVGKPSVWNKDMLIGALLGGRIGGLAGATAFIAVAGKSISSATLSGTVAHGAMVASVGTGLAISLGIAVTGMAVGVVIGGIYGKRRQTKEYALVHQQQEELQSGRSPERARMVAHAAEPPKQWLKAPDAESQLVAAAQPSG